MKYIKRIFLSKSIIGLLRVPDPSCVPVETDIMQLELQQSP